MTQLSRRRNALPGAMAAASAVLAYLSAPQRRVGRYSTQMWDICGKLEASHIDEPIPAFHVSNLKKGLYSERMLLRHLPGIAVCLVLRCQLVRWTRCEKMCMALPTWPTDC